mmetsp:Transcript_3493/g.4902  ORF Transcript_3493/g.4902 Transcript_3493/m.4902 type:complete len:200 (+) Transcript_3493:62-661(+)|eukprot:CAMPEP_0197298426 /NCGR_PEP_ID=MMETSP0890-20130614/43502_1 /TAXON_ID=44058 ORGANISM="Aureoumbra lagunensis, Strain CCMP1510" /NCGR_SAMPLE_ID=MMETSP0890 /ASSEMBLY_ACC=CAM_ASM_000533 /LENGTH=199 /DNA_ID=CAMNT_0042776193 /DNA_START=18 /DNA_END=617 /DNA_ORIENTATION=-
MVSKITRNLEKLDKPVYLIGRVIHGFGRGSSQLGFPTANLAIRWDAKDTDLSALTEEEREILRFAESAPTGIYAAWARVCDGPDDAVHKVAMSVGWNPTFTDVKQKTIECWLLHEFDQDFYDATLKVIVVAYVRDEAKFNSLDELIAEIRADGDFCSAALSLDGVVTEGEDSLAKYQMDAFFFHESTSSLEEEYKSGNR